MATQLSSMHSNVTFTFILFLAIVFGSLLFSRHVSKKLCSQVTPGDVTESVALWGCLSIAECKALGNHALFTDYRGNFYCDEKSKCPLQTHVLVNAYISDYFIGSDRDIEQCVVKVRD